MRTGEGMRDLQSIMNHDEDETAASCDLAN